MTRNHCLSSLLLVVAATCFAPQVAHACGGLFCSATNLQPVEQNGERILFELRKDGMISTTVEISYTGDAADFAWVVPVPDTPTLGVVPGDALALLDAATAPQITNPPFCGGDDFMGYEGGGYGGCGMPFGCFAMADSAAMRGGEPPYDATGQDPVEVEDLPQVGPYESQVVSSDDPDALLEWLETNGYLLTEAMEPFLADYATQGSKFLVMKLAPDATVGDIQPLRMTYPGTTPSVPLVLTSVSAEPEMGVMVFLAGGTTYESANWTNLQVDPRAVRADRWTGGSNYYSLLSWVIDSAGGHAFVTEFAGESSTVAATASTVGGIADFETYDWMDQLADRNGKITRLYSRVSGWEMTSDPSFTSTEKVQDVSNVLDLSNNECDATWTECGTTYCGEGSWCSTTDQGPGCVCADGYVARQIEEPQVGGQPTRPTIICQASDFELIGSVDTVVPSLNPCDDFSCGDGGQCVVVNGFATCDCAEGGAAVATGDGPLCVEAGAQYGPEALLPGAPTEVALRVRAPLKVQAGVLLFALAMLGPIAIRRRR